jgi:hypothetical protein
MRPIVLYSAALLFATGYAVQLGCAAKPAANATGPVVQTPPESQPVGVQHEPPTVAATQSTEQADITTLTEQAAVSAAKLQEALAKREATAIAKAEAAATTKPTPAPAEVAEPPVIETPPVVEVPPAGSDAPRQAKATPPAASDDPTDDAKTAKFQISSDDLLRRFATRAKEYPRDLAVHLDYQLLQMHREEKVPGMPDIAALPAEDRELLSALLDSLSNLRTAIRRDNNMLQSAKVRPLVELGTRLRAQSELTIPTVALCNKVKGFGVYEPVEPEFSAGRAQQVIVYSEVENFASQLNEQQQWETKLTQDVVLYTEGGLPVWQAKQHTVNDLSRNRRRDFFCVEIIDLPANLTIGRYLMKVTVVDKHANRIAESTLPVKIVARAGGPAGGVPNTAPATAPKSSSGDLLSPAARLLDEATK